MNGTVSLVGTLHQIGLDPIASTGGYQLNGVCDAIRPPTGYECPPLEKPKTFQKKNEGRILTGRVEPSNPAEREKQVQDNRQDETVNFIQNSKTSHESKSQP